LNEGFIVDGMKLGLIDGNEVGNFVEGPKEGFNVGINIGDKDNVDEGNTVIVCVGYAEGWRVGR